jgi:hypothetical protein
MMTEINLVAVVQDSFGGLLANVPVTFSTEVGSLASGGAAIFTDVSGQALDTLTVRQVDISGLTEPFFSVTARTTGEGGVTIEEIVEIDILGGLASLLFQASPTFVSSQTGGSINLSAQVFDGAGDPLAGINVNFLTEVGSLGTQGSIPTNSNGVSTDVLTVTPADVAGFVGSAFTVRAQARGFGGIVLEQTQSIRIQTGFPRASFGVEGLPGPEIIFTDLSTGQQPLSCSWTFGSGASPGTSSTCGDQMVTYATPGPKTVTLVVTNVLGQDETSTVIELNF